jgi:hypothetical protein
LIVQRFVEKFIQPLCAPPCRRDWRWPGGASHPFADRIGRNWPDGFANEDLRKIAVHATADDGETIHNEPFDDEPDMVADAIMAAGAMGRAWTKDHEVGIRSSRWLTISPQGADWHN